MPLKYFELKKGQSYILVSRHTQLTMPFWMYARILLEEREKKGEPLLCFMPKEPSLAARTGLKLSNHMGAPNSCTLMDLSPGGSTFQPASVHKQTYTPDASRAECPTGKRIVWEVPALKIQILC